MDITWLPTILLLSGIALLLLNGLIASRFIMKEVRAAQATSLEKNTYQKPNITVKGLLPYLAVEVVAITLIVASFIV